jgi:hypothetical protein
VGGGNHFHPHYRLARFRGLMYRVKYSAVIGLKSSIAWIFILGTYKKASFLTNHSALFNPVHQTTDFRQTTVRVTVIDPPCWCRCPEERTRTRTETTAKAAAEIPCGRGRTLCTCSSSSTAPRCLSKTSPWAGVRRAQCAVYRE